MSSRYARETSSKAEFPEWAFAEGVGADDAHEAANRTVASKAASRQRVMCMFLRDLTNA
jgi:hypothetical protein